MIAFPSGVHVWLATGHTDMRKGFGSLALQVQATQSATRMGAICLCFGDAEAI